MSIATTRVSSKGQVVIPESLMKSLGIEPGNNFIVYGHGDTVIFKMIRESSVADKKAILAKTRKDAKKAGITKSDINEAVRSSRRARRRKK